MHEYFIVICICFSYVCHIPIQLNGFHNGGRVPPLPPPLPSLCAPCDRCARSLPPPGLRLVEPRRQSREQPPPQPSRSTSASTADTSTRSERLATSKTFPTTTSAPHARQQNGDSSPTRNRRRDPTTQGRWPAGSRKFPKTDRMSTPRSSSDSSPSPRRGRSGSSTRSTRRRPCSKEREKNNVMRGFWGENV